MTWQHVLYALAIALIYVPMVFLGANAFFPDTQNQYEDCYSRFPFPVAQPDLQIVNDTLAQERTACGLRVEESMKAQKAYRFIFISSITLVALLLAAFIVSLPFAISLGLFLGGVISSFIASLSYMDANSRLGFGILVVLFVVVLVCVYRWVSKKTK